MPKIKQPTTLYDICVDHAAANIDDILKYEEQLELNSLDANHTKFKELPDVIYSQVSDRILEIGTLHDGNYEKILNHTTRDIMLTEHKWSKITADANLLTFLQDHCKNAVKINFIKASMKDYLSASVESCTTLIGNMCSSMVHLEWVNLKTGWVINDDCLKHIGFHCNKLKYLNLEGCKAITDKGIRALCDPSMAPYGRCTELTHLCLSNNVKITSKGLLTALHCCPNLKTFTSGLFINLPLKEVMDQLVDGQVFKLLDMVVDCDEFKEDPIWMDNFFKGIGEHFIFLENLTIILSKALALFDLHVALSRIHHLKLKSLTVHGGSIPFLNHGMFFLMRSVQRSLTSLSLQGVGLFDLKVIGRECPGLTTLTLAGCKGDRPNASYPDYHVDELKMVVFESLTDLTIHGNAISPANVVTLLTAPKLENLQLLHGKVNHITPLFIQNVMLRFPDVFSNLKSVLFSYMEVSKDMFRDLLDRAALLEKFTVDYPFCFDGDGVLIVFNEVEYFEQLVKDNNWALKCQWSGC